MCDNYHQLNVCQRTIGNCALSVCIVCLFLFLPHITKAQVNGEPIVSPVLLTNNTAAANGMGGVSITDVDASAALHNPGALGVFHLEHYLAGSLPNSTQLLEMSGGDVRLKSFALSVGHGVSIALGESSRPVRMSLAVAYSKTRFEAGELVFTNQIGEPIETVEPFDEVTNYTLSVGFDYYARIGFGVKLTKYEQAYLNIVGGFNNFNFLEINTKATSIGGYGELTFRLDNQGVGIGRKTTQSWTLALTPAFGYVRTVSSRELNDTVFNFSVSTPEFNNFGASVLIEVSKATAQLLSVRYASEKQDILYRQSSATDSATRHRGIEFGLLGTFYYRTGRLDDPILLSNVDTDGYGFRLRGVLAWMETQGYLPDESVVSGWLLRRIDLRYDRASYRGDQNILSRSAFFDTDFVQVVFALKRN